jgi:hypothetical protein
VRRLGEAEYDGRKSVLLGSPDDRFRCDDVELDQQGHILFAPSREELRIHLGTMVGSAPTGLSLKVSSG